MTLEPAELVTTMLLGVAGDTDWGDGDEATPSSEDLMMATGLAMGPGGAGGYMEDEK